MASDRKIPGTAFWITVTLISLVLYVASFGPACWLCHLGYIPVHVVSVTHWPIVWAAWHGPRQLRLLIYKYEAACQGRSGVGAESYFDNHDIVQRELSSLGIRLNDFTTGTGLDIGINAGYGVFDDNPPGANSPIVNGAPATFPD
jgi:hypothetical protein